METENMGKTTGIRVAIDDLRHTSFSKMVGTNMRSKRAKDKVQPILLISNSCIPKHCHTRHNRTTSSVILREK